MLALKKTRLKINFNLPESQSLQLVNRLSNFSICLSYSGMEKKTFLASLSILWCCSSVFTSYVIYRANFLKLFFTLSSHPKKLLLFPLFSRSSEVRVWSTLFENYSKCRFLILAFWHFPPIFVLLKLICLVTLFDRKL